ncbi:acyl-CoA dehydratase activase [Chloroflexota bacterium]
MKARNHKLAAGIDIGSLYTKTVLINSNGEVVSFNVIRSGAAYRGAAEASLNEALEQAGVISPDISYIVSTGYGRALVSFADGEVTEITCHARGVSKLFPQAHTIIDIGGQDSKVIYVNDVGQAVNFVMNDKCAAGTGRFLEVMAGALGVSLEQMSELSSHSHQKLEISSMCTVFAESEVISSLASGYSRDDIAIALYRAIARRVTGMVGQLGVKTPVVMTGGVAQSAAMVRALEEQLNTTLLIPEKPQLTGAFGAAIIAAERAADVGR